jgi:hypothetical protein
MSCAKHKFSGLKAQFVHKVVHNFVQSAGIAPETAFRCGPVVKNADGIPA